MLSVEVSWRTPTIMVVGSSGNQLSNIFHNTHSVIMIGQYDYERHLKMLMSVSILEQQKIHFNSIR